jgi:mannose-6-phosphate isomerase-like protein (cupin superfamily)
MIVQEKFSKGLQINHGSRCEWPSVTPGEHYSVRVSSDETDGTYTMLEIVADHRNGTLMHLHQNEDEHFIILEGMAHLAYGEKTVNAQPAQTLKKRR